MERIALSRVNPYESKFLIKSDSLMGKVFYGFWVQGSRVQRFRPAAGRGAASLIEKGNSLKANVEGRYSIL